MHIPAGADEPESLDAFLERMAKSQFHASLSEFAISFLRWRGRRSMMATDHAGNRQTSAWAAENIRGFGESFAQHFRETHKNWADEDIEVTMDLCFKRCASLADWHRLVIESYGIGVLFEGEEPEVPSEHVASWHTVTDFIDPDTLVTLLFAQQGNAQPIERLGGWPLTTRLGTHDLNVVLARGVSDLHVHLGGIRSANILWRKLLHDPDSIRSVAHYASRYVNKLSPDERRIVSDERDELDRIVLRDLPDTSRPLGEIWRPATMKDRRLSAMILAEARAERNMLVGVWRQLLQPAATPAAAGRKYQLERQFDRYLFAKNLFLWRHRQPQQTNPGLARFRAYYRTTERVSPKGRASNARYEPSPRIKQRELAEYAAYVAQSHPLRRLELRLAPPGNTPLAYHQFFKAWQVVEKDFHLADGGREIGFAVHFKRSFKKSKDDKGDAYVRLKRFFLDLDRETAVLHAYRRKSGKPWSEYVHRISRIDFAGQERDLPVQLASFCMNLVRGRPEALKTLGGEGLDERLHRFWLMHHRRGEATQLAGGQKLGVTCHAGEDYAHPLEGIYSVASAVESLKLGSGDTIGHGLALGADVKGFNARNSQTRLTSRGSQFDALLWLLFKLEDHVGGESATDIVSLRNWLLDEALDLYRDAASGLVAIEKLRSLPSEREKPILGAVPSNDSLAARMRFAECQEPGCIRRRARAIPIDAIVREMSAAITRVQRRVLSEISEKGVILEFNPSSNLRVSGSGSVSDAPFVAIIKLLQAQCLATINTDNPGVFGTRIENEYALVAHALKDAGFGRTAALDVIERLRKVGMELVWWPKARRPPRAAGETADTATDRAAGAQGS